MVGRLDDDEDDDEEEEKQVVDNTPVRQSLSPVERPDKRKCLSNSAKLILSNSLETTIKQTFPASL